MERLLGLLGHEHALDDVARELYAFNGRTGATAAGLMQLTCSDETERECAEALQRSLAEHVLPGLKLGLRASFRSANLGARYEPGSVHLAEHHYATAAARRGFQLLVVKVNSHVAVEPTAHGPRFGNLRRYGSDSPCCGALQALLDGEEAPFADELREAFRSGGVDRLAGLLDASRTPPPLRQLVAAVVNAGVQAHGVVRDILSRPPSAPALFVVLACVTLNRGTKDTELVCGIHRVDRRGDEAAAEYHGVGDDPGLIELDVSGRITVRRSPDSRGA